MNRQTKLIDCGATVFVYDFKGRHTKLGFEEDDTTDLKRLLLTNFVDDRLLQTFRLRISLSDYGKVQSKIVQFIKNIKISKDHSKVKYLAVSDLPLEENTAFAYVYLITDIELYDLINITFDDELPEDDYFAEIWGDEVSSHVYSPSDLLEDFSLAYQNSLRSTQYRQNSKILFKRLLQKPQVLRNEEADKFIKSQHLLSYPNHRSEEIFDGKAGFVIVNEYSL